MGLESFKTEGPRTRTKKSKRKSESSADCVHVLRGTDPDTSMVPHRISIHTLTRTETLVGLTEVRKDDVFVCNDCNSVSTTFDAKLKSDKLDFRETDWYEDFLEEAQSAAREVKRSRTMDRFSSLEDNEDSESEEDIEPSRSTGLDSFKTS